MFGRRFKLFTLLGFDVHIDISWIVLALLVTWSLAVGLFPEMPLTRGLSPSLYWIMGAIGALGLFLSIVLHELSHSLVARRYGLPMKGITLFIFGGVAEMTDEPQSPKAEFLMAIAGPASSVGIGLVSFGLYSLSLAAGWPLALTGVFFYLGLINIILAVFNMLPAFPLDGGRVLRSALWEWKDNIRWATRIASRIGSFFGFGLMALGILQFFYDNYLGGVWWFLIGMFLQNASQMSYRHLLTRQALEGERVRRFMKTDPVTVPAEVSVQDLVDNYLYRYYFKIFPVVANGNSQLVGCVTPKQVKDLPREEWPKHTVREIANSCGIDNTIDPDADALRALSLMNRTGNSRLLVVEGDRLVGVLALKDMMRFLSMKLDLEEYDLTR